MLRHKYTHLLLSGSPAPAKECEEIISASLADEAHIGSGSDGGDGEACGAVEGWEKDGSSRLGAVKKDPFAKRRLGQEGVTGRPHLSMRRRAGNLRVSGPVLDEEVVVSICKRLVCRPSTSQEEHIALMADFFFCFFFPR